MEVPSPWRSEIWLNLKSSCPPLCPILGCPWRVQGALICPGCSSPTLGPGWSPQGLINEEESCAIPRHFVTCTAIHDFGLQNWWRTVSSSRNRPAPECVLGKGMELHFHEVQMPTEDCRCCFFPLMEQPLHPWNELDPHWPGLQKLWKTELFHRVC